MMIFHNRYETPGMLTDEGRYEVRVACEMDFSSFPFDEQECYLELHMGNSNTSTRLYI